MDANLLKGTLRIKGYSIAQMVAAMNKESVKISNSTFYKKLRGESEFTAPEITAITKIANLSKEEMYNIFFKELVS